MKKSSLTAPTALTAGQPLPAAAGGGRVGP